MKAKILLSLALLPLLAGCAGYKSCSLNKLTPVPLHANKKISFAAKSLDEAESDLYLGRNVIKAGYTPIQIAIKNNSHKNLTFTHNEINMKTVPTDIVAEAVYQSIVARALGYGIPSLFFLWPLLVPAIVDSCWASEANKQLLHDYTRKSVRNQILSSNTSLDGLIFVGNNELKNELIIDLVDEDTQEKITCQTCL